MLVQELARKLNLPLEGDGQQEITAAAPVETAGPSDLAFLTGRAAQQWQSIAAGCLIAPPDFTGSARAILRAANPRLAFAKALQVLYPAHAPSPGVHPTAVIDPRARISSSASIGPWVHIEAETEIEAGVRIDSGCYIGRGVRIGENSHLYPRVTVYAGVQIGRRAILHSGCVLGADGFGFVFDNDHYEKFPQVGSVVLGDDVEIGANSCVDRAALGVTSIGDGTKLDNLVHIAHNCTIGRHVVIAAQTGISGGVLVEDYAVIGGQVGIGDKARIGTRAVLGSGCGVLTSKAIPAGQTVWGTPARPLRQYLHQLALFARLPQLEEEVKRLKQQLAELRSAKT